MSLTNGPILKLVAGNNRLERIWLLAKLDFQKRYYEGFLGMLWALLHPILRVGVYFVAFKILRESPIPNYALHLFSGLVIWQFVTEATNKSLNILRSNLYLINNIRFNWIDVYVSMIISILLGFLWKMLAFLAFCLFVRLFPNINYIYLPILILDLCITTLGMCMILSIFKLYVKDLQHLWNLVILAGFWTAPIFFPLEKIAAKFPFLIWIHPATPLIVNIRKVTMDGVPPDFVMFFWSILYGLVVFGIGFFIFQKYAKRAVGEINT